MVQLSRGHSRACVMQAALALFCIALVIVSASPASAAIFKDVGGTANVKLNDQGSVAFVARVEGQGKETEALFLAPRGGSVLTIASDGQASPLPGFRFMGGIGERLGRHFSLNNRNNLIFTAFITDGRREDEGAGIFYYSFSEKRVIPVMTSVTSPDLMTMVEESSPTLNDSDEVAFVAAKIGACAPTPCSPPTTRRLILYSAADQTLTEIIRTGDQSDGLGFIGDPLLNNPGTVVFAVTERNSGTFSLLFRKVRGEGVKRIGPKGDLAPLIDGFGALQLNDRNTIVFISRLNNSSSPGGIFAISQDDRLTVVALDKQRIDESTFLDFTQQGLLSSPFFSAPKPFLNNSDLIVFAAKTNKEKSASALFLTNPSGMPLTAIPLPTTLSQLTQFNNRSEILYSPIDSSVDPQQTILRESSGEFRVILDRTRAVPGLPQGVFKLIYPYALNDNREVGFVGVLDYSFERIQGQFVLEIDTGEIRKIVLSGETTPQMTTDTQKPRRRP